MRFWRLFLAMAIIGFASSCNKPQTVDTPVVWDIKKDGSKKKLILFVHGVIGDPRLTWTNSDGLSWTDWMKSDEEFNNFEVVSIGYDTPMFSKDRGIEQIVTALKTRLADEGIYQYDDIYFIAHSMGGLIVKGILTGLNNPADIGKLKHVKGVLFLSTPSQGSHVANYLQYVTKNPQVAGMAPAAINDYLQSLENRWVTLLMRNRGPSRLPRSYCAYEGKETVPGLTIVNFTAAASICDDESVAFSEDHISIAKPSRTRPAAYKWVAGRIREINIVADQERLKALTAAERERIRVQRVIQLARAQSAAARTQELELARQQGRQICIATNLQVCLTREPKIYGTYNQQCNNSNTHYLVRRGSQYMQECEIGTYGDCVGKCVQRGEIQDYCQGVANNACPI